MFLLCFPFILETFHLFLLVQLISIQGCFFEVRN